MKAAIYNKYGTSQELTIAEVPVPEIKPDQALVKVHASALNPVDWKIRAGYLKLVTGLKFPRFTGADFAGKIIKTGNECRQFNAGDEVFGMISAATGGACAEYLSVPENLLCLKPSNATFEEAAAIPLAAQTALQSLVNKANLDDGHHVLINGSSGGVGSFGVQISRILGAKITAVCSSRNVDLSRQLGAHKIIDYSKTNLLETNDRFHVFFDAVATYTYSQVKHLITESGVYVTTIPGLPAMTAKILTAFSSRNAYSIWVKSNWKDLNYLKEQVESGRMKPIIDKIYPLAEIAQAHAYSETGRAVGKIIIKIL